MRQVSFFSFAIWGAACGGHYSKREFFQDERKGGCRGMSAAKSTLIDRRSRGKRLSVSLLQGFPGGLPLVAFGEQMRFPHEDEFWASGERCKAIQGHERRFGVATGDLSEIEGPASGDVLRIAGKTSC